MKSAEKEKDPSRALRRGSFHLKKSPKRLLLKESCLEELCSQVEVYSRIVPACVVEREDVDVRVEVQVWGNVPAQSWLKVSSQCSLVKLIPFFPAHVCLKEEVSSKGWGDLVVNVWTKVDFIHRLRWVPRFFQGVGRQQRN
jgi:hypothetical protein